MSSLVYHLYPESMSMRFAPADGCSFRIGDYVQRVEGQIGYVAPLSPSQPERAFGIVAEIEMKVVKECAQCTSLVVRPLWISAEKYRS